MISARTQKTIFRQGSVPNIYEILGIDKNATRLEKLKAWRKKLLQTHPDKYPTVFIKKLTEKAIIFDDAVPGAAEAREVLAELNKRLAEKAIDVEDMRRSAEQSAAIFNQMFIEIAFDVDDIQQGTDEISDTINDEEQTKDPNKVAHDATQLAKDLCKAVFLGNLEAYLNEDLRKRVNDIIKDCADLCEIVFLLFLMNKIDKNCQSQFINWLGSEKIRLLIEHDVDLVMLLEKAYVNGSIILKLLGNQKLQELTNALYFKNILRALKYSKPQIMYLDALGQDQVQALIQNAHQFIYAYLALSDSSDPACKRHFLKMLGPEKLSALLSNKRAILTGFPADDLDSVVDLKKFSRDFCKILSEMGGMSSLVAFIQREINTDQGDASDYALALMTVLKNDEAQSKANIIASCSQRVANKAALYEQGLTRRQAIAKLQAEKEQTLAERSVVRKAIEEDRLAKQQTQEAAQQREEEIQIETHEATMAKQNAEHAAFINQKIKAFKRIYNALHSGQSSLLKTNWLSILKGKSDTESLALIEHHSKKKGSRTQAAWAMAERHFPNCSEANVDLIHDIYKYAFAHSGFWALSKITGNTFFRTKSLNAVVNSAMTQDKIMASKKNTRTYQILNALRK